MSNYIIDNVVDFDLGQTLECGQCFHYLKLDDNDYALSAFGRFLRVSQMGRRVILHNTTQNEYENIWKSYFDLGRNYSIIKEKLLEKDKILSEAINTMGGVRIMNQEFSETLMSFIISQNKQIPHIKQIVFNLSKQFGSYLDTINAYEFYSFPNIRQLSVISEDDFRACKAGFRAPYLLDAAFKLSTGFFDEALLKSVSADECEGILCNVKGVGNKVANCVMLFSLGQRSAFPIDVWIKRIMEELYFKGEDTNKNVIADFAKERYGDLGGYAQQYLFFYGKTMKIGTKN